MLTRLTIEVEFDTDLADADSLAAAADRLLQTALSTPGLLDDYGNPRFGEFNVVTAMNPVAPSNQSHGTEEFCPQNPTGHDPDWTSVHLEFDGEPYVDVTCRHCRRAGCLGSAASLSKTTTW